MANNYYEHDNPFVAGTLVASAAVNSQLDLIETGFEAAEATLAKTVQVPSDFTGTTQISSQTFPNKLIYINTAGNVDLYSLAAFDASVTASADSATASADSATASADSAAAAANSATAAATQVGLATDQVGLATTQVGLATTQAGLAAGSASDAANSATAAAAALPTGTTTNSMLRYNGSSWVETDKLQVDAAGVVTATAGLQSTGAGTDSFRAGKLAGDTNQGNNGIIISSTGAILDDTTAGHIHIASSTGSIDYTTAAGWTATDSSSTFSLKLAANLPLVSYTGPGVPTTIGIQIGSTAGTVAAGDDGRFDTVDISDLPAATALTGLELLSGLQDLDTVSMTTDQISGTPVTTAMGLGLSHMQGFSDFSNTVHPLDLTINNSLWGNDPYFIRLGGAAALVRQGTTDVFSKFFQPSAIITSGPSNPSGYSAICSTQRGIVLGGPTSTLPLHSFDTQFSMDGPGIGTSTLIKSHKIRAGFFDTVFNAVTPVNGMYFELNADGNNLNWQACVALTPYGGGTNTVDTVDTGITAADNTLYVLRVFYNAAQLKTEFFINNVLVATFLDFGASPAAGSTVLSQARPYFSILSMEAQILKGSDNNDCQVRVYHHKFSLEKLKLEHY